MNDLRLVIEQNFSWPIRLLVLIAGLGVLGFAVYALTHTQPGMEYLLYGGMLALGGILTCAAVLASADKWHVGRNRIVIERAKPFTREAVTLTRSDIRKFEVRHQQRTENYPARWFVIIHSKEGSFWGPQCDTLEEAETMRSDIQQTMAGPAALQASFR